MVTKSMQTKNAQLKFTPFTLARFHFNMLIVQVTFHTKEVEQSSLYYHLLVS